MNLKTIRRIVSAIKIILWDDFTLMGANLNHLFLRAVAEAGGFSRGAERIHISSN